MAGSKATITRDRSDGVVSTNFDAQAKSLLGCGRHGAATGPKVVAGYAYKEQLTRFETNLKGKGASVTIYLYQPTRVLTDLNADAPGAVIDTDSSVRHGYGTVYYSHVISSLLGSRARWVARVAHAAHVEPSKPARRAHVELGEPSLSLQYISL